MKKLFLFALLLSYTGWHAAVEKQENYTVGRMSLMTVSVMAKVALSTSLQGFARQKRANVQTREDGPYSTLFKNTQREIDISEQDILPVTVVSRDSLEDKREYAYTSSSCITVIPENFDTLSYGAQRVIALHEAFHHKYHDSVFNAWLVDKLGMIVIGTTTLTTLGLWRLVHLRSSGKLRIIGYLGALVVAFVLNAVACVKFLNPIKLLKSQGVYDYFKEFRADRDAVAHARCYKCIEEYSILAGPDQYLTKDELGVYIDQFKKENALCDQHVVAA